MQHELTLENLILLLKKYNVIEYKSQEISLTFAPTHIHYPTPTPTKQIKDPEAIDIDPDLYAAVAR